MPSGPLTATVASQAPYLTSTGPSAVFLSLAGTNHWGAATEACSTGLWRRWWVLEGVSGALGGFAPKIPSQEPQAW